MVHKKKQNFIVFSKNLKEIVKRKINEEGINISPFIVNDFICKQEKGKIDFIKEFNLGIYQYEIKNCSIL